MPASPTVNDLRLQFMAAQLGVPVASIQDLEAQFYTTYAAGGLARTGSANTFAGTQTVATLQVTGNTGLYGVAPVARAASVVTPTAPGAAYVQAEAQSAVTAINAIKAALTNIGITL